MPAQIARMKTPVDCRSTLEHNPLGWKQPSGLCPLKQATPARAFPA
jgi:hypothetical protein